VIHLPPAPTEAIIALSILFLAAEIVQKHNGQLGVTERWPWLIAFSFGLFHGLGFAGALSEIGVPQAEVPLALLLFNVGVETGQLLFIAVVLILLALLKRLPLTAPEGAWRVPPYAIGEAENGRVALDRMATFRPTLILLDLMMPVMDGFDFLVELHANPDWREIPVIVLTAKDLTSETSGS
jgi:CheY-like chemotaxis protein